MRDGLPDDRRRQRCLRHVHDHLLRDGYRGRLRSRDARRRRQRVLRRLDEGQSHRDVRLLEPDDHRVRRLDRRDALRRRERVRRPDADGEPLCVPPGMGCCRRDVGAVEAHRHEAERGCCRPDADAAWACRSATVPPACLRHRLPRVRRLLSREHSAREHLARMRWVRVRWVQRRLLPGPPLEPRPRWALLRVPRRPRVPRRVLTVLPPLLARGQALLAWVPRAWVPTACWRRACSPAP